MTIARGMGPLSGAHGRLVKARFRRTGVSCWGQEALAAMAMQVKRAGVEDAAVLAGLCDVVHRLHLEERPDYFKAIALDALQGWFEKTLSDPRVTVWLAEVGGQPVGYLMVMTHERAETLFCHARRWCELDQIAVLPGQRRTGVARALVEHAVAEARGAGFEQFELQCWDFNGLARAAFERLGFTARILRMECSGPG